MQMYEAQIYQELEITVTGSFYKGCAETLETPAEEPEWEIDQCYIEFKYGDKITQINLGEDFIEANREEIERELAEQNER